MAQVGFKMSVADLGLRDYGLQSTVSGIQGARILGARAEGVGES